MFIPVNVIQVQQIHDELLSTGYTLKGDVEGAERIYESVQNTFTHVMTFYFDSNKELIRVIFGTKKDGLALGGMVIYSSTDKINKLSTIFTKTKISAETLTALAYSKVAQAFVNKFDAGGRPYFEHCLAVCRKLGPYCTEEEKQAALLHDYLEDIDGASEEELFKDGFSLSTVRAVRLLSKVTYRSEICIAGKINIDKYYSEIKTDRIATLVKMADLRHNSDLRRLKGCFEKDLKRNAAYMQFYNDLEAHARKMDWI